ncbi:MAG: SOS response-associated peptidase [Xanthobacteraceae bacterium]|nr:SOS response-associated peptidase [Xanthobacteraceae bacterium]
MCGRFVLNSVPEAVRRAFSYLEQPNFPPRHNIAPTQPVSVVTFEHGSRHFQLMRWGLLPSWVKNPKAFSLVINARAETVLDKPAFKTAIKRRRCLVPADGYYEWQTDGARKQPYFIYPRDGGPMGFAGLHETWVGPNGEELDTVAIVTAPANDETAHLHARVPVVIAPADHGQWLDANVMHAEEAAQLLKAPPRDFLAWHPVSSEVNRVANDDAALILPVEPEPAPAVMDGPSGEKAAPSRRSKSQTRQDDTQGSLF